MAAASDSPVGGMVTAVVTGSCGSDNSRRSASPRKKNPHKEMGPIDPSFALDRMSDKYRDLMDVLDLDNNPFFKKNTAERRVEDCPGLHNNVSKTVMTDQSPQFHSQPREIVDRSNIEQNAWHNVYGSALALEETRPVITTSKENHASIDIELDWSDRTVEFLPPGDVRAPKLDTLVEPVDSEDEKDGDEFEPRDTDEGNDDVLPSEQPTDADLLAEFMADLAKEGQAAQLNVSSAVEISQSKMSPSNASKTIVPVRNTHSDNSRLGSPDGAGSTYATEDIPSRGTELYPGEADPDESEIIQSDVLRQRTLDMTVVGTTSPEEAASCELADIGVEPYTYKSGDNETINKVLPFSLDPDFDYDNVVLTVPDRPMFPAPGTFKSI